MAERKIVLFIGLDPDVVDYGRWPGLTEEKLRVGRLEADCGTPSAPGGYDASVCFIDRGETAERVIADALARQALRRGDDRRRRAQGRRAVPAV